MLKPSKKKIIIFASVLLAYSLFGFFLVPIIAQNQILKTIKDNFGVESYLEKVKFNPFSFEVEILNLKIPADAAAPSSQDRLNLGDLKINLEIFPLFKKEIYLKSLYLGHTGADFKVYSNGKTNWVVAEKGPEKQVMQEEKPDSKPWTLTLETIHIEDTKVNLTDESHRDALYLPVGPINLMASNISTVLGSKTSLEDLEIDFGSKGRLKVGGSASLKPVTAQINFSVTSMPLDFLTSYMSDTTYLSIKAGTLNAKGSLRYSSGVIEVNTDAQISKFNVVQESTQKPAFDWESLDLQKLSYRSSPPQVHIEQVDLKNWNSDIVLKKEGVLNFKDYLRKEKPKTTEVTSSPAKPSEKKPMDLVIDKFSLSEGNLQYTDQEIKPNFTAKVSRLSGTISPITNALMKKINVNLSGKVEAEGKFKAKGYFINTKARPNLDLGVDFNNIEMTTFTPYAGKFAGYEISKGKLFLNLNYTLQNNFIRGKNNVVLDQFTLGKAVESENSTNLPVKLALALLKDRDGKIIVNLPVEGDVNSPQFSIGGLIFTALKNMIINIVAAPFDFLKGILGGGDNLDSVFFQPGTSDLAADQQTKIGSIAKALVERPNLTVEVQGSFEPLDIEAMKQSKKIADEEETKALATARGQAIQSALVALHVEAERVYLLSGTQFQNNDKAPRAVLSLKSRD
ncbi:MAG: DUF748 domain-containing protein [Pseudobdellovibrio sp.]